MGIIFGLYSLFAAAASPGCGAWLTLLPPPGAGCADGAGTITDAPPAGVTVLIFEIPRPRARDALTYVGTGGQQNAGPRL